MQQNMNRTTIALLYLKDYLTTRATRCHGVVNKVALIAGSDGECHYRLVGTLRLGSKDSGALGTQSYRKGGILLICSYYLFSVLKSDARSHAEVRIWRIGVLCGFHGLFYQTAVVCREFVHLAHCHFRF